MALTTLYAFPVYPDWANPIAGLTQGSDGDFYGTTSTGGTSGNGTVYKTSADGALTILYSFTGGIDGATPYAALLQGNDGCFYGTTSAGGGDGHGAVFKITTNGALTTLYSFNGTSNGGVPYAALMQASDGYFYGTTTVGGTYSSGTVFKISTNGAPTTLTSLTPNLNGATPYGALVQGADGNFYGTTYSGGIYSFGSVFRMSTNGRVTRFFSFTGGTNGENPYAGLVLGSDGNFYGTTQGMGTNDGTIFRINTNGTLTTLYSFTGGSNGAQPNGLVQGSDGDFYGTTRSGYGTVFKISANGDLTTFYSFNGFRNGGNPQSALAQGADGNFYGTTCIARDTGFPGTAFKISTNGVLTTLHSFGNNDVAIPNGLAQGVNGGFYGTTFAGGSFAQGTVFEITTNGAYTSFYAFEGGNGGGQPSAALVQGGGGTLYGTTFDGGTNGDGTVFRIDTSGVLDSLYSFTGGNDGAGPGALALGSDGNFYGTTEYGGSYGSHGTVFKISPAGTFASLHSFTGTNDGANPLAGLAWGADGSFYGTTSGGGTNGGYGTVFKISTNGTLASLHSFAGIDGAEPSSALVQGIASDFYGTTYSGGANNFGTIFKIDTSGALTSLYSFTGGDDGVNPNGPLLQAADGFFYGTTAYGGIYGSYGTLFKISAGGTLTSLYSFNGTNSEYPTGALVQASDGSFYGATLGNGLTKSATIFRLTLGPEFQAIFLSNGTLSMTLGTDPGGTYQLQYSSDLGSSNWTNLGGAVTATGATTSFTDSVTSAAQRFYRVVLLP